MEIRAQLLAAALAALLTSGLGAQPSRGAEPVSLPELGWSPAWYEPLDGYRGPTVRLHFRSVVPEGANRRLAWARWSYHRDTLSHGGAKYNARVTRYRVDCPTLRLQPLANRYFWDDIVTARPVAPGENRVGAWISPEPYSPEYGIATTACLPQALGGGSPFAIPEDRWRSPSPGTRQFGWDIDAAPPARYGDRLVAWFRSRLSPPRERLDGRTVNVQYDWVMIDCATSRRRVLRTWQVSAGAVVDSLRGVGAESDPIRPPAAMTALIRAACEGPYLSGATPPPPPG
jgi:hypothetical protein